MVWVLGIAAGAIELQLDKVSYAGISFTINSVEKLQGLIYCVVVLMYFATIGMVSVMMFQFISVERINCDSVSIVRLARKRPFLVSRGWSIKFCALPQSPI
ncbi:hypothetical protein BCCGELA001_30060 [Bradyrhizobium sp. CCGE-LA001]|nr:hypothetical protein BCCGELA001_30060 [Bradyrhizobium sp. CCGE-LA001]